MITGQWSGYHYPSIQATDPGNVNVSGAFTQANSNDNCVEVSAIPATGFTR